jgi:hypothetical protein
LALFDSSALRQGVAQNYAWLSPYGASFLLFAPQRWAFRAFIGGLAALICFILLESPPGLQLGVTNKRIPIVCWRTPSVLNTVTDNWLTRATS